MYTPKHTNHTKYTCTSSIARVKWRRKWGKLGSNVVSSCLKRLHTHVYPRLPTPDHARPLHDPLSCPFPPPNKNHRTTQQDKDCCTRLDWMGLDMNGIRISISIRKEAWTFLFLLLSLSLCPPSFPQLALPKGNGTESHTCSVAPSPPPTPMQTDPYSGSRVSMVLIVVSWYSV